MAACAPIHAFQQFLTPVLHTIILSKQQVAYPTHWNTIIFITMDSHERGVNPVTVTIVNPRKDISRTGDLTCDLPFSSHTQY